MARRVFEVGPSGEAEMRPVYDREARMHERRAHYKQKAPESTWAKIVMKLTGESEDQWVERMVKEDMEAYDKQMSGGNK